MKFTYLDFTCDVDMFEKEDGVLLRFYDGSKEQSEREIVNLVIVHSGFGFLCLKIKGESGLISGYLDESIFTSEEMIESAIEFLKDLPSKCKGGYIPHHVDCVKLTSYIEFNGEY